MANSFRYREFLFENGKVFFGLSLSALLILLVLLPSASSFSPTWQEIQAKEGDLKSSRGRYERIKRLVASQQALKTSLTLVDQALPSQDEVPGLMNQIQSIATSSGVTLKALQFGGIAPEGLSQKISLQTVLEGSYVNLLSLLKNLELTSRLINVAAVSFDSQKGADILTATLTLNSYFLVTGTDKSKEIGSSFDFAAGPVLKVLDLLKSLKVYQGPANLPLEVGKVNPFQ